jgi:hypothetical protein
VARNRPQRADRRRTGEQHVGETGLHAGELALGEGPEIGEDGPAGERLGQRGDGQEAGRPREEVAAGYGVAVDGHLDPADEVVAPALHLVDGDGPGRSSRRCGSSSAATRVSGSSRVR